MFILPPALESAPAVIVSAKPSESGQWKAIVETTVQTVRPGKR